MNGEDATSLPENRADAEAIHVRAFLIADIRGYTRYTAERGDEAAAVLASAFASLTRQGVEAFGGQLVELRGDEALAVFTSTRQAIRAALDLQRRYGDHSLSEPDSPLGVGIGIDAGEAVAVEGGYRGGALNLAARLCSIAGAGHILATDAVTHLARKVEGIEYLDQGARELKGLDAPVRVVEIVSENAPPVVLSGTAPIEPGVAEPANVPFANLSNRIEAAVEDHLLQSLGRWTDEGRARREGSESRLRDQIQRSVFEARNAAMDTANTQRALRDAPPRSSPLPPSPSAARGSLGMFLVISVVAGVIITVAIVAAILVIILRLL